MLIQRPMINPPKWNEFAVGYEDYNGVYQYNTYFREYITPVAVRGNDNWYFTTCDSQGKFNSSKMIKAQSPIDVFNWIKIERGLN